MVVGSMNQVLQLGGIQVDSRGEMGPESDVDIMVEFEQGARIGLIRRVDLVTKRGLKPWVRSEVLKDARVIYAA
jgi:uncharacterized protein